MTTINSCTNLGTIKPKVTKVEGIAVSGKSQGISVSQGQVGTVEYAFHNDSGDPVNFSECNSLYIKTRTREALSFNCQVTSLESSGTILDAANGIVTFPIPVGATDLPGVMACEIGIFNSDNNLLDSNVLYILVNRGQFAHTTTGNGPPTEEQIRLRLRDSAPEDNFLLTTTEFDAAEIAYAIIQTIQYWNETAPQINVRFNTSTFSFEGQAIDGIIAKLYQIAASHYRREHVVYSAAGVAFDDMNKSQEYETIGKQLWDSFARWTKLKKTSFSMAEGFGGFGSRYRYSF